MFHISKHHYSVTSDCNLQTESLFFFSLSLPFPVIVCISVHLLYGIHQSQESHSHCWLHNALVSDLQLNNVYQSALQVVGEIRWPVLLTLASLVLLLVLYYGVECVSDDACFSLWSLFVELYLRFSCA